jgi:nucleotide-binding universal stress UspA family protein
VKEDAMTAVLPTRAVLAATDLTEASDPVLRAAAAVCARTGATLHVLHAFDFAPSPYMEPAADAVTFQGRLAHCESDVRAQVARTVPAGVRIAEPRVEIYAAHRAITEYAHAIGAELVVIGPHARREMEIGFLGGTADRVLRTLEVPCLVVRGELRLPPRHVVVPMDLSEWARAALDVAVAWARGPGAAGGGTDAGETDVFVIHVAPRALTGPGLPFEQAEVLPGWNEALADAVRRAGPGLEVREAVLWGDRPADEIVEFAAREQADLLVMATHGYGAVKRALLGGTAQSVARRAPCPVLMVPPRMWVDEVKAAEPALNAAELFAPPPV